jgi:hypothetical protein
MQVASQPAQYLKTGAALRHPRNVRGCPAHGYPYNIREFAELVANHPLFQPGVAEDAANHTAWLSRQVS